MTTSNNNTNLTELWEKGKLEVDQYYYVKYADGSVEIQLYVGGFLMRTDNRVVEVLAPVPTFDEMKLVALKIDCVCETIAELAVEKEQLKELLLRCKRNFDEITKFCNDEIKYAHEKTDNFCIPAEGLAVIQSSSNNKELLTKIDEVLK